MMPTDTTTQGRLDEKGGAPPRTSPIASPVRMTHDRSTRTTVTVVMRVLETPKPIESAQVRAGAALIDPSGGCGSQTSTDQERPETRLTPGPPIRSTAMVHENIRSPRQSRTPTLDVWTDEEMESAKPYPLPEVSDRNPPQVARPRKFKAKEGRLIQGTPPEDS